MVNINIDTLLLVIQQCLQADEKGLNIQHATYFLIQSVVVRIVVKNLLYISYDNNV